MNIEEIIKVPYTTQPRMSKNQGEIFNKSPDPKYIQAKKHQLELFNNELHGETYESVTNQLVRRASAYMGLPITGSIIDLSLQIEEDIAIMHNGILSSICFCFPSGWIPRTALGKTLAEIHSPVADGDHLRKVSDKLTRTMSDPVLGSFRRTVWTITKVPGLSCHPSIVDCYREDSIDLKSLFFRWEEQTTFPFQDCKTSLFFVKVNVVPLISIWDEHNELIKDAIDSMSDAVLQYKNLHEVKHFLKNADVAQR